MQALRKVIAAVRREIEAACRGEGAPPPGSIVGLHRAIAELQVTFSAERTEEGREILMVYSADAEIQKGSDGALARTHTITLEFTLQQTSDRKAWKANGSSATGGTTVTDPIRLEGAEADEVTSSLLSLFGPPGFDSSARATVFREALEGVPHDRARIIVDSLQSTTPPGIDDDAKRIRHLVSRVLTSGPLKSASRGAEVLGSILDRHTLESILRLIHERWKTQDDWMNES